MAVISFSRDCRPVLGVTSVAPRAPTAMPAVPIPVRIG